MKLQLPTRKYRSVHFTDIGNHYGVKALGPRNKDVTGTKLMTWKDV